ncbi:MAG: DNA alkylation repair protein [candidate division Zixibacteria bacterium]|nr:DNA alkylation repair protein [candidate division Zixibacteria bacterium]
MKKAYEPILEALRRDIQRHDKPLFKRDYQRFFKEKLAEPVSIKTDVLRAISGRTFRNCRSMTTTEILNMCDEMLTERDRNMRFVAFDWAEKLKGKYNRSDFSRFENWLSTGVDNWGACDHLCCGALGQVICQYPDFIPRTRRWVKSRNRWVRRGAAVSLIVSLRQGLDFSEAAVTSDLLMSDRDDLVQKGCGWMLKEASRGHPREVFAYVVRNSDNMPRTTLRYAIEKLPPGLRKRALAAGKGSDV